MFIAKLLYKILGYHFRKWMKVK